MRLCVVEMMGGVRGAKKGGARGGAGDSMEESGGTHQIGHRSNACQVALMMPAEFVRVTL